MAKSLGIPFGTYRGWNAYRRLPDVSSGHRIAQALGVTVEYLVSGKDPEKPDTAGLVKQAETLLDGLKKL